MDQGQNWVGWGQIGGRLQLRGTGGHQFYWKKPIMLLPHNRSTPAKEPA